MSESNVYGQSIEYGTLQYLDVLDLLSSNGYRATFTQTGGMSAASNSPLTRTNLRSSPTQMVRLPGNVKTIRDGLSVSTSTRTRPTR